MNLIFTVTNSDKPDAKITFNSGAKMLFNKMTLLKKQNPEGLDKVSEHFTPAQVAFLIAAHGVQDSIAQAHEEAKSE